MRIAFASTVAITFAFSLASLASAAPAIRTLAGTGEHLRSSPERCPECGVDVSVMSNGS